MFDFQEALSYIKAGLTVSLTLEGKERKYKLNKRGDKILCIPNNKSYLTYPVTTFHSDAIMSNNWKLCDPDVTGEDIG
jgi:hypothetical protein